MFISRLLLYSYKQCSPNDCFACLLQKKLSDSQPLWAEARKFAIYIESYLIVDETICLNLILEKINFVRIDGVEIIILQLRELV
jgi:hypothetical protein